MVEDSRQPVHVVRVEVGEDDDRHGADIQPTQAPLHRQRVRPGVDDDRTATTRVEHQAVALR